MNKPSILCVSCTDHYILEVHKRCNNDIDRGNFENFFVVEISASEDSNTITVSL